MNAASLPHLEDLQHPLPGRGQCLPPLARSYSIPELLDESLLRLLSVLVLSLGRSSYSAGEALTRYPGYRSKLQNKEA